MLINFKKISSALHLLTSSFSRFKRQFIIMTLLGFVGGLFGGIGISAIIPLFSFITTDKTGGTDIISKTIEKLFSFFHINYTLTFLIIFIIILFIFKAVILYIARYYAAKVTLNYEAQTRKELFKHLLNASWPYLLNRKVSYLERVLMFDTHNSSSVLSSLSSALLLTGNLTVYVFIAFNISSAITLLALGTGAILFFTLKPLFYRVRKLAHEVGVTDKQTTHHIDTHLIGAKTVKSFSVEKQILKRGSSYFDKLRDIWIRLLLYENIMGSFFEPVSLVFVFTVFAFTYRLPGFSIATFAVTIYLIQKIFTFMQSIQGKLNSINAQIPFLKSTSEYGEEAKKNKEPDFGSIPFSFNNKLELKKVKFSYEKEKEILSEINLSIKKGEMVGLVGPSGAGKTTLIDLLLRLLNPDSGEILLDDKNITRIDLQNWRQSVGYVSQDIFLLDDTIENNIKFYDDSISDKDMIKAAKMAYIYDFIKKQPEGFSTTVGEMGVKLSTGQRQRITLARALAKKPQILLLDEATSALDNESERMIQNAIENLHGKITIIAIAHRLTTIMNSDRLFILEEGTILEEGNPQQLLRNKDSHFYKLYNVHTNR